MREHPLFFSAVLSGLALVVCDSTAAACSGPVCGDVAVVGSIGIKTAMGTLPENTPAIGVGIDDPRQTIEGPLTLYLQETSGTSARDVAITWDADQSAFLLSGPLTPGSTVKLAGVAKGFSFWADRGDEPEPGCSFPMRGDWQVTEAAALPTVLGTLTASYEEREVNVSSGGPCFEKVLASTARVRIAHAASAEPWRDLLVYETWVDGMLWYPSVSASSLQTPRYSFDEGFPNFVPGGSNIAEARGEDLLVTRCPDEHRTEDRSFAPGKHTVEMRARLPGGDVTLSTEPIEIDLPPCKGGDDSDGGTEEQPPSANAPDAAAEDANGQEKRKSSGGCSALPSPNSVGSLAGGLTALLYGLLIWRGPRRTQGKPQDGQESKVQ